MKFHIVPVLKTDLEADLYEAASMLVSYFNANPDEPFVDFIMEENDEIVVSGKINNPMFDEMIEAVHIALHRHKLNTAVRTVEIR